MAPNEHVLITGANRGIGLELTRQAAASGAAVTALVRTPVKAEALHALAEGSDRITVLAGDVTDPATLALAAASVEAPIDLLVCNAGQYRGRGRLGDPGFAPEDWSETLMTNVAGVYFTVEAFLPHLRRAESARIAIISSIMASSARAPGGSYIYRASKAAATNLACNLARDLRQEGIAVGSYHPGWVRTDMGGGSADIDVETAARGLLERFASLSPATSGVFEDYRGTAMAF
ncbi:MAG: SDR family oxidoreductase [Pseudomonadota bacterium]